MTRGKMMSGHEKKAPARGAPRVSNSSSNSSSNNNNNNSTSNSPSVIAQPPRAALSGRSKAADHPDKNGPSSAARTPPAEDETESEAKDRKIAELEKEMATMADEFERELTQLSHKLTNESETAIFWQQKHSTLNQTYLKTDTDLRLLRHEIGNFQDGREEREKEIKTRISSLALDRDAFREAYNEAMGELRAKENVIASLQGQVRGLKSFVSMNSKMEEQITDESIGERMHRLGNGLQNWVITNFRRVKIDTENIDERTRDELLMLVPTYEPLSSSTKINLIQSLLSRLLMGHVFGSYFVGLPQEAASELRKTELYLKDFGSSEGVNQWRSATLALLRKEASDRLQAHTTTIVESIIEEFNAIMDRIGDLKHNETRDSTLKPLVYSSVELSRLLRVQKAVFSVEMPMIEEHQRTMFNLKTMEDISGEDEDALIEREILCVVFPGIIKSGDENGERSHLKNVVAKIRVLCSSD